MRIIDLTHPIRQDMPVFPGSEPPVLYPACTIEKDLFREKKLTFYSHTGTHIDSPYHILQDGISLDQQDIGRFFGRAVLIDCSGLASERIEKEHLEGYGALISGCDFVILKTGWSRFWGNGAYFKDYPVLSPGGAEWLTRFKLKGVGADVLSIDTTVPMSLDIHKLLLGKNINIIENLTNLGEIDQNSFLFSCMPLFLEDADGSPVRAAAILDV